MAAERPRGSGLASAARALAFAGRALERAVGDMTLAQFRVLSLIASSPERAGELARRAAVSKPSLTGLIDGLTARGWVKRSSVAGDRRGVDLVVTETGRAALDSAEACMVEALDRLLGGLDAVARRRALDGLLELDRALWTKAPRDSGGAA